MSSPPPSTEQTVPVEFRNRIDGLQDVDMSWNL
jgi:hypothetical protein